MTVTLDKEDWKICMDAILNFEDKMRTKTKNTITLTDKECDVILGVLRDFEFMFVKRKYDPLNLRDLILKIETQRMENKNE